MDAAVVGRNGRKFVTTHRAKHIMPLVKNAMSWLSVQLDASTPKANIAPPSSTSAR
jgi:predicted lipoprotein